MNNKFLCDSITLLPEAASYVRDQLGSGGYLSQRVWELHRNTMMDIRVYVRSSSQIDDALFLTRSLHVGGILAGHGSIGCTERFLADLLHNLPHGIMIFDDAMARPSDQWLVPIKNRLMFCGDEVYHFSHAAAVSSDTIADSFAWAHSAIGFVGGLSDGGSNVNAGVVARVVLEEFAITVTHIIVEAFDGEGFLVAAL